MPWILTEPKGTVLCASQDEFVRIRMREGSDPGLILRVEKATRICAKRAEECLSDALNDLYVQLCTANVTLGHTLSDYLYNSASRIVNQVFDRRVRYVDPLDLGRATVDESSNDPYSSTSADKYHDIYTEHRRLFPDEVKLLEEYYNIPHGGREAYAEQLGISHDNIRKRKDRADEGFLEHATAMTLHAHSKEGVVSEIHLDDGRIIHVKVSGVHNRGRKYHVRGVNMEDGSEIRRINCGSIVKVYCSESYNPSRVWLRYLAG